LVILLNYRLPSSSDGLGSRSGFGSRIGGGVGLGAAIAGHNVAVAASHVSDGCSLAMTFGQFGTGGTGVVFVKAKAMGPAVKHLGAVIGSGQAWCDDSSRGAGGVAEPAGNVVIALALWNPAWLVVRRQRCSLFATLKTAWNSVKVLVAVVRVSQVSHAWENTPVASKRRWVRSMAMASEMGSAPAVAIHQTSRRCSHNNLIGSFRFHNVLMLARFFSRSEHVKVP